MAAELRDLGSRTLWVVDEGEGAAIIFIHGLGGTSNVFDPAATALGADHRVICFDLTGHGMSPPTKATSVTGWADDVVAILDSCAVERASIVAHSMGTLVAQQVVASHPHRVDKVALLGPIRDVALAGRQAQRDRAAVVRESGMAAVAHTISRGATSAAVQAKQPAVVAFVKELLQRQPPEGYAAACEALAESSPPDVSTFERPVLLVTGSDDGVSPADRLADVAAVFASARTAVIDGIGHWTSVEAAADVNRMLADFFAED
jgi:pimeloyl-ACP methyl ester carboxylesterase